MKRFCFVMAGLSMSLCGAAQRLKPVSVGEFVPDLPVVRILNYEKPKTTLYELNKGQLLILDFWATWCAPCVGAFPKLDSLQKKFPGQLRVVSVTSEKEDYVDLFLQKQKAVKGFYPVSVVNDRVLRAAFPHSIIPHYVWINKDNKVVAITRRDEVNEENIRDFLAGNLKKLPVKFDNSLKIDRTKPFFLDSPQIIVPSDKVVFQRRNKDYQSILTRKVDGITPGGRFREHSFTIENNSLKNIAAYIWGKGKLEFLLPNRTILQVRDSALFTTRNDNEYHTAWADSNIYSYELVLNDTMIRDRDLKFTKAIEDLNAYYLSRGVEVERKMVPVKILALIRTTPEDKLQSKGLPKQLVQNSFYYKLINGSMKDFSFFLIKSWQTKAPFEDETNYTGNIDIEINADINDIGSVNKELDKYGLKVVEKEKSIDMIILTQK